MIAPRLYSVQNHLTSDFSKNAYTIAMQKLTPTLLLSIIVMAVLTSCSSSKSLKSFEQQARQEGLEKAFLALENSNNRQVASIKEEAKPLVANFKKLRFEQKISVFPIVNNITHKNQEKSNDEYWQPSTYSINAVNLQPCKSMYSSAARGEFKKYKIKEHFKSIKDSDLDCAILKVYQSAPKIKKGNRKMGDLKETYLYIDSQYRTYGVDFVHINGKRENKTSSFAFSKNQPSSSFLSTSPIDLPILSSAPTKTAFTVDDIFVQSKVNKQRSQDIYKLCNKKMNSYEHFDQYENKVNISWCPGDAWPTSIKTNRYLAIINKK